MGKEQNSILSFVCNFGEFFETFPLLEERKHPTATKPVIQKSL